MLGDVLRSIRSDLLGFGECEFDEMYLLMCVVLAFTWVTSRFRFLKLSSGWPACLPFSKKVVNIQLLSIDCIKFN